MTEVPNMVMVDVGLTQKVLLFCRALKWTATWEGCLQETRVAGGLHEDVTIETTIVEGNPPLSSAKFWLLSLIKVLVFKNS